MRSFFNSEKGLWRALGWLGDLFLLSMLWTVGAALVLTAGAATAALYDAVVHGFRRGNPDTLMRFFSTFRRELKGSLLPSVLCEILLLGLFWVFRLAAASVGAIGSGIVLLLLLIPVGMICWVFPLLSRFALSFGVLFGNSIRLALAQLPRTLGIAAVNVAAFWLTLRYALLPLFVVPALTALLCSFLMEPVFRRYE